ncbi:hypothetical protein B0T10DRAFT_584198 [Thelonectria olida]|uniref:NmrA-like domain-containing protein n=1 Tax=Thelonectria olida TaxID=1576542 RepID=A0A9P8WFC3_9HYPO|nr:hypothetical protein B0T10DRAFT_584198 [Thelonectria olida]
MTSAQPARTIVVLGATGNQGRGVVRALLEKSSPSFDVRAITRDIESPAAQRLRDDFQSGGGGRLTLAKGNIYDVDSLRQAFKSAYGVFSVTHNRLPGKTIDTEDQLRHELDAGRNIVEAAEYCKVQHFVMSSLPNLTTASGGVFPKVFHFDYKHEIEQLARKRLFYTNMLWSQYCRREEDGTVRFCAPVAGDTLADWVDPGHDIGVFASEAFTAGPGKTGSKTYPVVGPKIPFSEFAKVFSKVTSKPSRFESTTIDEWGSVVAATVGKGYEEDIRQMMQWIAVAPNDKICYGTMSPEDDTSWEDLGVRASTFEEWLARSKWEGPN